MIMSALMVLLAALGGIFAGFTLNTQVLNPPSQVWGVCPSPAHILPTGCTESTVTTQTVNGQIQIKNVTVPAGYILANSTNGVP